jgi:FkbM family methyltransferase
MKTIIMILKFLYSHPLGSKNKLYVTGRFLWWQIISRLSNSNHVFDWVNNTKISLKRGQTGLTGNLYTGFMEFDDMVFLLHFLKESDHFVDIGANVGAYTLLASGVIGVKTDAYEPINSTLEIFREQLTVNKLEKLVNIYQIGIGKSKEETKFTNNSNTTNHVVFSDLDSNYELIKIESLDDRYNLDVNTVVKIDVEGYESLVIEGGERFFSSDKLLAVIIELNGLGRNYGREDIDIHEKLISCGFKSIKYNAFTREIVQTTIFDQDGENTIYVRDIDDAFERVMSAPKVVVKTMKDFKI